jgi:hypothetical protein
MLQKSRQELLCTCTWKTIAKNRFKKLKMTLGNTSVAPTSTMNRDRDKLFTIPCKHSMEDSTLLYGCLSNKITHVLK